MAKRKRRTTFLTTLAVFSSFVLLAPSSLSTIITIILPAASADVLDIDTVNSGGVTGAYTDIAHRSNCEYRYISYYDATNGNLRVARSNTLPNQWKAETVDSVGNVGWYTSIALAPSGGCFVHVSYWDVTNTNLKYARKNIFGWSTQTVESVGSVGHYTSIADLILTTCHT